jgi:hypothetical protein
MPSGPSFTVKSPGASTPVSAAESSDDLWQRFDLVLQNDREKTEFLQVIHSTCHANVLEAFGISKSASAL